MNRRIVIPGGSGRVGRVLARYFHAKGDVVTVLSRNPRVEAWPVVEWNGRDLGPWAETLDGTDVVINLTGRNVDCRYTEANRREIMDSRVCATAGDWQSHRPSGASAAAVDERFHSYDLPACAGSGHG